MENRKIIGCVIAYADGHNNYGTSLQGFATIKKLQDLGYRCEIIHYIKQLTFRQKLKMVYMMFRCGVAKEKICGVANKINMKLHSGYRRGIVERTRAVDKYKDSHLKPLFHDYIGFEALCNGSKNYDVVLVGSDQVWTPLSLYTKFYNLLFVDVAIPKVAYASSFGVSRIPTFQHQGTKEYLNRFYRIGVREVAGREIVKSLSDNNAVVVADPTMLLSKDEWDNEISDSTINENEPYIFCYFLGANQEARIAAKKLKQITGYNIVTIRHMDEYVAEDECFGDKAPYFVGPNDFVKYISQAAYVCTDSFHCTVFSILYNRKFMSFYRFKAGSKGSRNSRIDSLLDMFGLTDRIFKGDISMIKNEINYELVGEILVKYREDSIDFLKNALR